MWVRKAGCQGQQLRLNLVGASVADFTLEISGAPALWEVLGAAAEGAQCDRDTVGATCAILPEVRTLPSQYRESSAWFSRCWQRVSMHVCEGSQILASPTWLP